jgi:CelD/BcsL family acetyltransferase involved in cellulose biosynthesis
MNLVALARSAAIEVGLVGFAELPPLAEDWRAAWSRARGSVFQSPAWLLPWARAFAPGRCWAATYRVNGELVGLLPVFVWDDTLMLAGTDASDLGDGVFVPAHRDAAARLLARAAGLPGFTRIDLRQLPADSPLVSCELPGWTRTVAPDEPLAVAPVLGPDGLDGVNPRVRKNWRYALRRAEREGFTVGAVERGDLEDALTALAELHGRRWETRGEDGVLADSLVQAHLAAAVPALHDEGALRMIWLRKDGRPVAVLLGFQAHGETSYYISGFDPAVDALSPGTILVGAAMGMAAAAGDATFNFLRGQEAYKYKWGAVDRPTSRVVYTRV